MAEATTPEATTSEATTPGATMAGTEQHTLSLSRVFAAPRERVYRAFSDGTDVARWFGPHGYACTVFEFDCRPGGHYRLEMRAPDGGVYPLSGTFREVARPERLVYTWVWGGEGGMAGMETLVALEFRDLGGDTEVHLTHSLLPSTEQLAGHQGGWTSSFEDLDLIL